MAVGIFAGIPVNDFQVPLVWYKRLLGIDPAFFPNDVEAVWQLAEDRYVYIIQDADRAGGAVSMIWVDDPVAEAARISDRGLEPVDVEKYDRVWKYVFHEAVGRDAAQVPDRSEHLRGNSRLRCSSQMPKCPGLFACCICGQRSHNGLMRIGELADLTGVSQRSLRYYEEQRLVCPRRSEGDQRVFTAEDVDRVIQIQELFAAGFCSKVIQQLLPEIDGAGGGSSTGLELRFIAAEARLEDEKRDIERELAELRQLRQRLSLASDTHVRVDAESHEQLTSSSAAPIDHRDRRLR